MGLQPKRAADSATEMVQVVLPNDANALGFILGGTVMHLIDIAGAIACHRHTRTLLVTAAVDGLEFLHPIKVGDLIILKSRVTCVFRTSLEVCVDVYSEETLTGIRQQTSRAFLTFVAIDRRSEDARDARLQDDQVTDLDRVQKHQSVDGGCDEECPRVSMRGNRACDVD